MNYIGSKYRLTDFIKSAIVSTVGSMQSKIFAEPFSGTGAIARSFKTEAKQLIVNDVEPYSYVLAKNYIGNTQPLDYQELVDELNALKPKSGFIYKHYCLGGSKSRQYFSDTNGKKIDAIRSTLELWKKNKSISVDMYYFLLASLIESADKVANTASVYGAYLKHLKPAAQKLLVLKPALFQPSNGKHKVYNKDANELIKSIEGDVLYLDPPYNGRQYGAYYHLLNTIALYDKFVPRGVTGMRDYYRSSYCITALVKPAFEQLIADAKFKTIFLSYNNEGIMKEAEVKAIMKKFGTYSLKKIKYQRFKADSNRANFANDTTEFLHILKK